VPNGELLSADALSPLVDVHPETLRRKAREGVIPSYKIGNALRFDLDEVREACRATPGGRARASTAVTPNFDALETRDGD
jgi:excisionase family DNA binding protein